MENKTPKKLYLVYIDKSHTIEIDDKLDYNSFINKVFCKITGITNEDSIDKELLESKFSENFYITWITKVITRQNWNEVRHGIENNDTLFVSKRLKGGWLLPPPVIILAIFALLFPLLKPIAIIVQVVVSFFELLGYAIDFMVLMIDIIPLIFDPPTLMNDILFAVTYGINQVFQSTTTSIKDGSKNPEEEGGPRGPMDIDESVPQKCISPTFTTIILLIICPPLAILFKLGFWAGFISSIICGVLCVKLYYFPGLLFAILHVLC